MSADRYADVKSHIHALQVFPYPTMSDEVAQHMIYILASQLSTTLLLHQRCRYQAERFRILQDYDAAEAARKAAYSFTNQADSIMETLSNLDWSFKKDFWHKVLAALGLSSDWNSYDLILENRSTPDFLDYEHEDRLFAERLAEKRADQKKAKTKAKQ